MNSRRSGRLDAIDWRIIEALQLNARISLATLGRRVGLSQPAVSERVKRQDCLVLKVVVPRAAQLQTVVDRLAKHGSVTTSIVLSSLSPVPVSQKALGTREK
jgi:hypothetical protein